MRPSALHRGYAFLWMYIMGWTFLVAATVFEDRFQIATGYIFVFLESALFLAAVVTLCELFALPKKSEYALLAKDEQETAENIRALPGATALIAPDVDETMDEDATETTPLFGGGGNGSRRGTTFAHYARRSIGSAGDGAHDVENKVRTLSVNKFFFPLT